MMTHDVRCWVEEILKRWRNDADLRVLPRVRALGPTGRWSKWWRRRKRRRRRRWRPLCC